MKVMRTPMDIAHEYGFALQSLCDLVDDLLVTGHPRVDPVNFQMLRERLNGRNMTDIGKEFGVSRERVRQRTAKALYMCRQVRYERRCAAAAVSAASAVCTLGTTKGDNCNEAGKESDSCSEGLVD